MSLRSGWGASLCSAASLLCTACQAQDLEPATEAVIAASEEVAPEMPAPEAPAAAPVPEVNRPATFTYSGQLTQGGWIRGVAPAGAVEVSIGDSTIEPEADGSFFVAFDRDAPDSEVLIAQLADGTRIERQLTVTPRAWNIERVNVARTPSGPSEAFMKRRMPELEQIVAARAIRSDVDGWRQDWVWPVKGRISGRFGSQRIYRGEPGSYHTGLDISTGESGTPIVAPADGVVVLAVQGFSLEGNLLMIDHGMGLNSAFLHLSNIAVKTGDRVTRGQHIGNIGSSGRATGPHLHWSIKWMDARLDPLLFVDPSQ